MQVMCVTVPLSYVLYFVLLIRCYTLPGSFAGLQFIMNFQPKKLANYEVRLEI